MPRFPAHRSSWRQRAAAACAALGALLAFAPAHADPHSHLAILHTFDPSEGINPRGSLVLGADHALYGTAYWGGDTSVDSDGSGTVFRETTDGTFSVLHTFNFADGSRPAATLVQTPDGRFWGTTAFGGASGNGVIFSIDAAGHYALAHSFDGTDGAMPNAGLAIGADGLLYGTTTNGGPALAGTLFSFDPATAHVTLLHTFNEDSLASPRYPEGGLAQGTDGAFYGTTAEGGAGRGHHGTIFRMALDGSVTTLHNFSHYGNEGCRPYATLLSALDGRLVGTTSACGNNNAGGVFAISTDGAFSVLQLFDFRVCGTLYDSVAQGADGTFYGTAEVGGFAHDGCAWSLSPAGDFATLVRFKDASGAHRPWAGLTPVGDALYGVSDSLFRLK